LEEEFEEQVEEQAEDHLGENLAPPMFEKWLRRHYESSLPQQQQTFGLDQ